MWERMLIDSCEVFPSGVVNGIDWSIGSLVYGLHQSCSIHCLAQPCVSHGCMRLHVHLLPHWCIIFRTITVSEIFLKGLDFTSESTPRPIWVAACLTKAKKLNLFRQIAWCGRWPEFISIFSKYFQDICLWTTLTTGPNTHLISSSMDLSLSCV